MRTMTHTPRYTIKMTDNNSYLERVVTDLKAVIDKTTRYLRKLDKTTPFDGIAFTGMSGCLVAPAVAARLGKAILAVRKDESLRHSFAKVEGDIGVNTYIIVDDFIDSGKTANTIIEKVWKAGCHGKCLGVVCYARIMRSGGNVFLTTW